MWLSRRNTQPFGMNEGQKGAESEIWPKLQHVFEGS